MTTLETLLTVAEDKPYRCGGPGRCRLDRVRPDPVEGGLRLVSLARAPVERDRALGLEFPRLSRGVSSLEGLSELSGMSSSESDVELEVSLELVTEEISPLLCLRASCCFFSRSRRCLWAIDALDLLRPLLFSSSKDALQRNSLLSRDPLAFFFGVEDVFALDLLEWRPALVFLVDVPPEC